MTRQECNKILITAISKNAWTGNANVARKYLNAGDLEGFERICRGTYKWLNYKGIPYVLTDGAAENYHDNEQLYEQATYFNGQLHGDYTSWYSNGRMSEQSTYVAGKRHGECTWWHFNGPLKAQLTYINGEEKK
jgi:MORN repeat variant